MKNNNDKTPTTAIRNTQNSRILYLPGFLTLFNEINYFKSFSGFYYDNTMSFQN